MADFVNSVRQLFQDVVAPEIRELRGDVRALDVKIDAVHQELDTKIGALDTKMDTKFAALDTKFAAVDTKIGALDTKMDTKFAAVDTKFAALDTKIGALDTKMDMMAESLRSEMKSSTALLVSTLENASLRAINEDKNDMAALRERIARIEERLALSH